MASRAHDLAQCRNLDLDIAFLDDQTSPDPPQQLVLGDELPAALHQREQQVERARVQGDRLPGLEQASLERLQLEPVEPVAAGVGGLRHRGNASGCASSLARLRAQSAARFMELAFLQSTLESDPP